MHVSTSLSLRRVKDTFLALAHLARYAPRNARVKYAIGSNLTGSITP